MAFKSHPKGFRLGISEEWREAWFGTKEIKKWLKEDIQIREILFSFFPKMTIDDIFIERTGQRIRIIIKTPKPGMVIGKKGDSLRELTQKIKKILGAKKEMGLYPQKSISFLPFLGFT